jgi:hypothetical protein
MLQNGKVKVEGERWRFFRQLVYVCVLWSVMAECDISGDSKWYVLVMAFQRPESIFITGIL